MRCLRQVSSAPKYNGLPEMPQLPRVLVALNESSVTKDLVAYLDRDYEVIWVREGQSAYEIIDTESVDALICGLRESHIDGLRILAVATQRNPETAWSAYAHVLLCTNEFCYVD